MTLRPVSKNTPRPYRAGRTYRADKTIISQIILRLSAPKLLDNITKQREYVTAQREENGQESKTVITAVDELLQFAKDVNAGKYDNRTNAVVSLEADLDLTGVEWTPIGCTNDEGDVEHYFSGKFYGNGHSISNIDYASMYGKEDIGGLFGFLGGGGNFRTDAQREY